MAALVEVPADESRRKTRGKTIPDGGVVTGDRHLGVLDGSRDAGRWLAVRFEREGGGRA